MGIAGFFCTGLASEEFDQRRLTVYQEVERGMDGIEVVERIHALGAGSQFAWSLRSAEEENAHQGDFMAMKINKIGEAMLKFGYATVGRGGASETLFR